MKDSLVHYRYLASLKPVAFQSLSHPKATLHFWARVEVHYMLKATGRWFLRILSALTFCERILIWGMTGKEKDNALTEKSLFFLVLSNFILKWMLSEDLYNYTHRYIYHSLCSKMNYCIFLALFKLSLYNTYVSYT